MKRISNEDGRNASARNFGRLALGIIPLALGVGASAWLGVWIDAHYFREGIAQESRRGVMVNAPTPIKAPLKVTNPQRLHAAHVDIDSIDWNGGYLTVRFRATHDANTFQVHWAWIAPDRTHMGQSWADVNDWGGPFSLATAERGIVTIKPKQVEDRASELEVWMVSE